LTAAGAISAGLVVATVGQTVSPLRKLALLAPRRPDIGAQGFPVNKTAAEAGVTEGVRDASYTLTVVRGGETVRSFTLTELEALPRRTATLPISCVEGWSASRTWTGVSVRDILAEAGIASSAVAVESLQRGGRYRRSQLERGHVDDADTMLATHVEGEPLHVDHGFPLRLIAPNRPGVLQTKWVVSLVVS
jgi:DMSO/TMAO reductase YedYZ molybdopterin-dependent catalytic subunit